MTNHRFWARLGALAAALALAVTAGLAAAPHARAAGDLDEIRSYTLEVTPADDGTLAITAAIDWEVLDSTSEGPLEWVQIGIPNEQASEITALTDTISEIYRDGSYLHVTFDRSYTAGETVHFSFSWVQSYMYTLGDNGSVTYDYTPGWFDNANVDAMRIRWNTGAAQNVAFTAGGTAAQRSEQTGSGWYEVSAAGLGHGETLSVTAAYASWPQSLSADQSADHYAGDTYYSGSSGDDGSDAVVAVFFTFFLLIMVFSIIIRASARYDGGFYAPTYVYVGGLYYPKGPDGHPRPGSVGVAHPPAAHGGFHGMGGGGSFGGGAGRGGGGCACASSCACACACACAGGGRAGCSAKNLYSAVHLNAGGLAAAAQPDAPAAVPTAQDGPAR